MPTGKPRLEAATMIYTCKSGEYPFDSKHNSFQGKCTFVKLPFDFDKGQGHQNKVTSWDNPKSKPVQVWGQSTDSPRDYISFSENLTYLSPPVTLNLGSRSPNSNQPLSLSQR